MSINSLSTFLKDFYHEAHEDHEESARYKNVFVLFVGFVVNISLHLELLTRIIIQPDLKSAT
jgi:hypothetical protein